MASFGVLTRATASNTSSYPLPTFLNSSQPLLSSTEVKGIVINIIFGVLACIIGFVTIWQAHRAWHIWHMNHNSSRPRRSSHVQTSNNVRPPPPYSESPNNVADGPQIPLRTAEETTASGSQAPEGSATPISSDDSGIQLAGANPIPMNGLRAVSTNDENAEHAPGV